MMLLNHISSVLMLDSNYIDKLASEADFRYKRFFIDKADGSKRAIYQPSKELKTIQRVLLLDILDKFPLHDSAFAYRKGRCIKDHAMMHVSCRYLLRLDFKRFFESIRDTDIESFLHNNRKFLHADWDEKDDALFIKIICRKKRLTIGAVTSPAVSNAICYNLDERLSALARSYGVIYTRYADDIYFSSKENNVLQKIETEAKTIIKECKTPNFLTVNNKKTNHSSKKSKMIITGLVISNDGKVTIGHKNKRELRSSIHNWSNLTDDEKIKVSGYISFLKSVEPGYINNLCKKYSSDVISDIISFHKEE